MSSSKGDATRAGTTTAMTLVSLHYGDDDYDDDFVCVF